MNEQRETGWNKHRNLFNPQLDKHSMFPQDTLRANHRYVGSFARDSSPFCILARVCVCVCVSADEKKGEGKSLCVLEASVQLASLNNSSSHRWSHMAMIQSLYIDRNSRCSDSIVRSNILFDNGYLRHCGSCTSGFVDITPIPPRPCTNQSSSFRSYRKPQPLSTDWKTVSTIMSRLIVPERNLFHFPTCLLLFLSTKHGHIYGMSSSELE